MQKIEAIVRPEKLEDERKQAAEMRKKVRDNQPLVKFLTELNQKLHIQNTPEKYGDRKKDEPWNPEHSYFATVAHLLGPVVMQDSLSESQP